MGCRLWVVGALATTSTAWGIPPVGLQAWEQFDRIGELRPSVRTYQTSSHEPFGGNRDSAQFLETTGAEHVLLDVRGPGCIYRIWMTGIDLNAMIRIYFDEATTPTVEMTLGDFFSGVTAPFLRPLVGDDEYSSGGFVCYLPIQFEAGCRVTTESPGQFYNITYQKHADATGLTSFTGTEDDRAAAATWEQYGRDPKADSGAEVHDGSETIAPGESLTLAEIEGPASIQQIELTIPGMNATAAEPVWDDGRAHQGYSQFEAAIDPDNNGVRLTRRLDYGISDQEAAIFVDGELAGTWLTPGSAAGWLDDSFEIPAALTTRKSEVTVTVAFIDSAFDWNESHYWIDSIVAGQARRTDEVDVGDPADEADHSYGITDQTWEGSRTLFYPSDDVATDEGYSTRDWVEFEVAIDPDNIGVSLSRRVDYTTADQRGSMFVDGQPAGEWATEGLVDSFFFDDVFEIPPELTAGKSKITVGINAMGRSSPWTEFRYGAFSKIQDVLINTDIVDVGNSESEAAHNYYIDQPTVLAERTFPLYQPPDPAVVDILMNSRIVATWDDAIRPQINVPLGGFFGSQFGPKRIKGLPVGMDGDRMYCWFPMPFADNARITLVNDSDHAIDDLSYRVAYSPRAQSDLNGVAHFHAKHNEAQPAEPGRDYVILDETGAGHLVGVVHSMRGPSLGYLEGDERVHIDGNLTPALYGTGSEDFYNGGFYFNRGRFSLPTHGNPTMEGTPIATDMYRFLVGDVIPFTTSIKVGMQHGGNNDTNDTGISSIAFYYKRRQPLAALTDELDVGEATSEAEHNYTHAGSVWHGRLNDEYEGDDDDIAISDDGRRFGATPDAGSDFTVAIDPCNTGVLLRRRMNYFYPRQEAEVYVDGELAGIWYDAGNNITHRFRDSEFMIPASLTQAKSNISLEIRNVSPTARWTEYRYWVYTMFPESDVLPKSESHNDIAGCARAVDPPPNNNDELDEEPPTADNEADIANLNDNADAVQPDASAPRLPTCGQGVLPFGAIAMLLCSVGAKLGDNRVSGPRKKNTRRT